MLDELLGDEVRVSPNTEAEQAVLGAMMLDKQCALAASRLDKEDFYHAQHGIISNNTRASRRKYSS